MLGAVGAKTTGIVLDVARQRGGVMPGVVTLHDHSRFSNDGTMTNITWVQLPSGLWVMNLNGTTGYVTFPYSPSQNPILISVLAWVFTPTDLPAVSRIVVDNDAVGGLHSFQLTFSPTWTPRFHTFTGAGVISVGTTDCRDDTWHFLAGVYDGTNQYIYVDAVAEDSDPQAGNLRQHNYPITIGRNPNGDVQYLEALVAMVRIYSYALTPAQIRAAYTATRRLVGA